MGKLVEVQDKYGRVVFSVGPTVTSIGAYIKAGFPVVKAVRGGKVVWVQKGDEIPAEQRNRNFGFRGYQG